MNYLTNRRNMFSSFKQLRQTNSSARKLSLFIILGTLPILGVIMVAVCALNFIPHPFIEGVSSPFSYWVTLGYGLLIGGAAYVAGGFGGFLFGLPRYLTNPDSSNKNYSRNDNLIQISDWLTKIIVGLGLTNLYKIPDLLDAFGNRTGVLFLGTGPGSLGAVFAEVIVIYFLVCGFLLGYLWTNIQYIPILTESDEETKSIAEAKAKEAAANAVLDAHTESVNASDPQAFSIVEERQKSVIDRSSILSSKQFSSLIETARAKMQAGLRLQASLPEHLRDPNKNQWGGKSENTFRKITGRISPIDGSDLFRIVLTVTANSPEKPMKTGDVIVFSLHPTFPDPLKIATVKDEQSTLEFISYGAFTVGVLCDDGSELEYDLAELPSTPRNFIER